MHLLTLRLPPGADASPFVPSPLSLRLCSRALLLPLSLSLSLALALALSPLSLSRSLFLPGGPGASRFLRLPSSSAYPRPSLRSTRSTSPLSLLLCYRVLFLPISLALSLSLSRARYIFLSSTEIYTALPSRRPTYIPRHTPSHMSLVCFLFLFVSYLRHPRFLFCSFNYLL